MTTRTTGSRGTGHRFAHRASPLPPRAFERSCGAASAPFTGTYRRRQPETTVLHSVVRENLETFLADGRRSGDGYPTFVERELRRYLDCGILAHGFARVRCASCAHELLVAFSCKGRLCPSCQARRMSDTAAYLVDQLLPAAPYRQWVLTVPWPLRYRLSIDRRLLSLVLDGFLKTIFSWQRRRGRELGIAGECGAVTFVQRFGSAINLHPHLHSLLPDGLFVSDGVEALSFVSLPPPTDHDVEVLLRKIAERLTRQVGKLADEEADFGGRLLETAAAMEEALAKSLRAPAPAHQLDWLRQDHQAPPDEPGALRAKVAGFSLHAGSWVPAEDREALERLCRYGLRAPFSQERLSRRPDGQVVYSLRRPWPHARGVTHLVLEPLDFLRRLAALVPPPGLHMVRYHGVLANRAKLRARLPPPPPRPLPEGVESPASREIPRPDAPPDPARVPRTSLSWAQLLLRVFFVDALVCTKCGGRMTVIALLTDPLVVRRVLEHLQIPATPPPIWPARSDPGSSWPLHEETADEL